MNREYFSNQTRLALIYLKSYNQKLCRKGLLDRCLKAKLYFGDYKNIECDYLKKSLEIEVDSVHMVNFNAENEKQMTQEIEQLKESLNALNKSIITVKRNVEMRLE